MAIDSRAALLLAVVENFFPANPTEPKQRLAICQRQLGHSAPGLVVASNVLIRGFPSRLQRENSARHDEPARRESACPGSMLGDLRLRDFDRTDRIEGLVCVIDGGEWGDAGTT
jgi:hypothetical protein